MQWKKLKNVLVRYLPTYVAQESKRLHCAALGSSKKVIIFCISASYKIFIDMHSDLFVMLL